MFTKLKSYVTLLPPKDSRQNLFSLLNMAAEIHFNDNQMLEKLYGGYNQTWI